MAAAAVVVNWQQENRDNTNYREEVVNVTTAATLDWYDSPTIAVITAVEVSPNYAIAAADAVGCTFAANRVVFNLVAGAAAQDYTIKVYGAH